MAIVTARLDDPYRRSMAVFGAIAGSGIIAVLLGTLGAARNDDAAIQLAYLTSGGLGGLGLIGFGLALLVVQRRRRAEATERERIRRLAQATAGLLVAAGRR